MNQPQNLSFANRQQGFVLIVALVLLLILTIIGVAASQRTTLEQKMAGNAQNHDMAFQAAEAALRAGESGIEQGTFVNFAGDSGGLFLFDPSITPQWLTTSGTVDSSFLADPANMQSYTITGNSITNPPVFAQPLFMIEQMPPVPAPGQSLGLQEYGSGVPQVQVYRITALGWGGDANGQVVLQSVYRP
ncbi:MAG: pilus assembly PilX family protein [Gammaproteobacteria bacterium]